MAKDDLKEENKRLKEELSALRGDVKRASLERPMEVAAERDRAIREMDEALAEVAELQKFRGKADTLRAELDQAVSMDNLIRGLEMARVVYLLPVGADKPYGFTNSARAGAFFF